MNQFRIFLICAAWTLCSCGKTVESYKANDTKTDEYSSNELSYEDYELFLNNQVSLYEKREFDELVSNMSDGDNFNFPESPTYFHYIFGAVEPLLQGDEKTVKEIVDNFDLMISIDLGSAKCDENDSVILENGTKVQNRVVSNEMCHEAFFGYYGEPSDQLLAEIQKYKTVSENIKRDVRKKF